MRTFFLIFHTKIHTTLQSKAEIVHLKMEKIEKDTENMER